MQQRRKETLEFAIKEGTNVHIHTISASVFQVCWVVLKTLLRPQERALSVDVVPGKELFMGTKRITRVLKNCDF